MDAVNRAIDRCSANFGLLDSMVADNAFLLGDRLSLADMTAGTHLYRFYNLGIDWPDMPHLAAYYERLVGRQSYAQHVMVPFDELYGRLSF